jgi:hypothetical protein
MKWTYALSLATTLASAQASATFLTGQKLYQEIQQANVTMTTANTAYTTGHAYGYVSAIYDEYEGMAVCPPDGATGGQMFKIVENYLGAHPESWNLPASVEVTKAITNAWPCAAK